MLTATVTDEFMYLVQKMLLGKERDKDSLAAIDYGGI
jgi:hypothetical protein